MSEAPVVAVTSSPEAVAPAAIGAPDEPRHFRARWESWMHAVFTLREDRFFLLLAVLIGIFAGLVVVCFRLAIEWTQITLLGPSLSPSFPRVVVAPVIAGIVVALLAIHVFPRVRGSGVNQVKSAMYISNGYVPFRTVIGKFFACALAIGSGQSLGPEDPSLLMGAGIASLIGRSLRLSQEKVRLIAPVGTAAGLAAAFNAPISAVLFVIEEVIGTWSAGVLGAIVLAAVSSVVTMRAFLGPDSLFRVPPFRLAGPGEILAYAALGVAGGAASLVLLKWIVYARPKMQALPHWTQYFQPAAAGLLIGLIGMRFPQVMGAGYAIVDQAMHGQFVWQLLLLLAALKLLVTGFSFLSGTPGGLFAPTIFIGAMLGGAVGSIEHHFFPALTATIGTFALVGIGTLFAGFLRTPITSVFMVIELSGNYTAILPVIISTMIAYGISRAYQKVPLFDLLARQDGLVLPSIEERREMTSFVVEDAMRTDGVLVAEPGDHIVEVAKRAETNPQAALLLRMRPGEWWLLDREDVMRLAPDAARTTTPIHAKSKGPVPYLFRDQSLAEALQVMGDWPVLPVASRADLAKLEGILTLADTLHAFRKTPKEE
ncbi:MAG TPA: chloride channel protein [Candidatus Acidoferrales bacterium]|nr:chloride channel protein [Candidatus Acidoferrales bacterium]